MRFGCESRTTRRGLGVTGVSLSSCSKGTACRIVTEGHLTTTKEEAIADTEGGRKESQAL